MTSEQIEKIKTAAREIKLLSEEQDKIYNKLIKEIAFEKYEQAWSNGTEETSHGNPTGYLFDTIYNTILEEDIDESIEKLIAAKEDYDNGNV